MSRTNIEYLFQVPAPIGDRAFGGPPRSGNLPPAFDDHLSQASVTTLNDAGKTARRDDADYAPPETLASESASDDDPQPAESAASETAAASSAADAANSNHDDAPEDNQPAIADNDTAETNSEESRSEALEDADQGGEPDEEESGEFDDASAVQAGVIASAAAATIEALPEIEVEADAMKAQNQAATGATEGERPTADPASDRLAAKLAAANVLPEEAIEHELKTLQQVKADDEPINSAPAAKAGKKSRSATKAIAAADDDSPASREIHGAKRHVPTEPSRDGSAQAEIAKVVNEQSETDELLGDQQLLAEQDTASDEPSRVSMARTASRSRTDAAAITSKIAVSAMANGVVTQPAGGEAKTQTPDDATQAVKQVAGRSDGLAVASARLQANQGSAKRGGQVGSADDMPRVDAARFVGRVAKAFHTAHERGGTLQLRLSPPELGSLRLELTVKDGVMTAALETETASARRVLLDHLPALRDRLAEQNIRVERFDVDVRRDGSGGQADPRASQDHQQPQQGHHPEQRRQTAVKQREETPRHSTPIVQPITDNAGINLVA